MSSLPYLTIVSNLSKVSLSLTVITNSLVIYLTSFKIKAITFEYRVLIILSALFGIFFLIKEVILHPFMHSFDGSYIYFAASQSRIPITSALLSIYSLIYMIIICLLAIQFIYRYCVLLSEHSLIWFSGWKSVIWVVYSSVFTAIWACSLFQCRPDDYSNGYLRAELIRNYQLKVEELAGFHVIAYNSQGHLRLKTLIGIVGCTITLTIQYLIIFFCAVRIHFGIKSLITMISTRKHRLHRQLFKTLVLQITIPTFVYSFPAFIVFYLPFLNLKMSFPSGIIICLFNIYPAMDSLVLMLMVAEYRRVLRSLTHRLAPWSCLLNRIEPSNDEESTEEATN